METSQKCWRIIYSAPAAGAWNMAVDEAILEHAGSQLVPPTLRLYAWQPACLSLGLAQPVSDVNQPALEAMGWQLVRRPTGGRAILHTDELTYAICGTQSEPCLAGGVLESYREIAKALLRAVELLGVIALSSVSSGAHPGSGNSASQALLDRKMDAVCFVEPSNYEITAGGKKLIGSAQARRANAVLQHGTLPLYGDLGRIVQVLRFASKKEQQAAANRVSQRATTVEQVLGTRITWEAAAWAFQRAFEEKLGLNFQPGELTASESDRAQELLHQKYANPDWTERM
jgi:lipoyl(octanoyl) transferase